MKKTDYQNPLYDIDDDATVAEFCLQERVRGRIARVRQDTIEELDLLEEENEDE